MNPNSEPSPKDRSLTRAERRRLQKGQAEAAVTGKVGCKFCKSTLGTYTKGDNRFRCKTQNCRGN